MAERRSDEAPASVQLGHGEVDPTLLEPVGSGLEELLGPPEGLEVRVDQQKRSQLPEGGWRQVGEDVVSNVTRQVLAAPHPTGGWVLVTVFDRGNGERMLLSAEISPVRVLPGRATRRAPLVLRWPSPVVTTRGVVPELRVELTNTTSERWTNRAGDRVHVVGRVQDLIGKRVAAASPWTILVGTEALPGLEPDQRVELPVNLEDSGIDRLHVGRYQLDAVLLDLDLHTEGPTPLHLI